ncbi:Uncharacterised protein [Mycobacteroides abscessus subsp. abscessus]|nr:Uncharacterised protein [Mycobacteroides abscessus subsp. abscessus]SKL16670.1 Uncharacterised protein [Mycobacteroides abscessus subsp. abscessus]
MVTGVPPSAVGVLDLPSLYSGKSSFIMMVVPLILTAACITLPSGVSSRPSSSAPKAFL